VNGHHGNKYLRELAMARKPQFDVSNFSEKRALATEIVKIIQGLQPPGRFLRLVKSKLECNEKIGKDDCIIETPSLESKWEEVDLDKAIHKTCQVMRDIDRQDRKARIDRKLARMNRIQLLNDTIKNHNNNQLPSGDGDNELNRQIKNKNNDEEVLDLEENDRQNEVENTINAIIHAVDNDCDKGEIRNDVNLENDGEECSSQLRI
jgi:hypothetical protein